MLSALILLLFLVILYITTVLYFLVSSFFVQVTRIYIYFCFFRLLLLYWYIYTLMPFFDNFFIWYIFYIAFKIIWHVLLLYIIFKEINNLKYIVSWFYSVLFFLNKHNVPFKHTWPDKNAVLTPKKLCCAYVRMYN